MLVPTAATASSTAQEKIDAVNKLAHACKAKIEALDKDNDAAKKKKGQQAGSASERTRTTITAGLKKKLKDHMQVRAGRGRVLLAGGVDMKRPHGRGLGSGLGRPLRHVPAQVTEVVRRPQLHIPYRHSPWLCSKHFIGVLGAADTHPERVPGGGGAASVHRDRWVMRAGLVQ